MSNYSKLYWFTRLDIFQGIFIAATVIIGMLCIACVVMRMFDNEVHSWTTEKEIERRKDINAKCVKWFKKFIISFFILLSITLFIPSKNDAILIMAGGKTLDFVESDTSLNKIPAQTTKLITDYLQKQLDKK